MSLLASTRVNPMVFLKTTSLPLTTQTRSLQDIPYFKVVEWSHLHSWEAQSSKRKFMLKLEQREKEKAARSQKLHTTTKLVHPSRLEPIELPEYIERSPSEILRLLSSAVNRDFTAPDYQYHDDPYLIPYNSLTKRDFVMSKDSGRKAARFILNTHPEFFDNNLIEAQPPIKSFMPKAKYTEKNVSVELLNILIEGTDVQGAIEVYELLKRKKISVDVSTKQGLLEIVCFHNEAEEISETYQETAGIVKPNLNDWLEGNMAEQIYQDLTGDENITDEEKTAANIAILCGMVKHRRRREAWIYYEMTKDVKSLKRFNAGILCVPVSGDDFFADWEKPKEILKEMAEAGIKPDGITLMNLLDHIRRTSSSDKDYSNGCKMALSVLAEFKSMDILPSLGSYKALLKIFYTQSKKTNILFEIVQELQHRAKKANGSLLGTVIDQEDFGFFKSLMEMVWLKQQNLKLAYKIHKIVTSNDDNLLLLGDYNSRSNYYRFFMLVLMRREPLDVSIEYFSMLVPNIWSPMAMFYKDIVKEIQTQGGYEHLPRVWTELMVGDFCGVKQEVKFEIMEIVSRLLSQLPTDASGPENLKESMERIASDIFNELDKTKAYRTYPLSDNALASSICNDILSFSLNHNLDSLAINVFKFCRDEVTNLMGNLDGVLIAQFVDQMISKNEDELAFQAVVYSADQRLPSTLKMAQSLAKSCELSEVQKSQLNLLLSHDMEWTRL